MVQTDRDYPDLAAVPRLLTGQRVTFKFKVVDFHTVPAKRQYRWQLFQGALLLCHVHILLALLPAAGCSRPWCPT